MNINKIGVVLPTYNSGPEWKSMLKRFTESLVNISNVDNLEFLINAQHICESDDGGFLSECIQRMTEFNKTWKSKLVIHHYEGPISMVNIRNDCMSLDPSCDLYMFVDDDIKFNKGAGDCYNEIIGFFESDPKLGMVMSAGYLGGYNYKHQIKKAVEKHWWTNRGLFFRNLHFENSPIFRSTTLDLHIGGYEDMLVAFTLLSEGYDLATHFNNPTSHKSTPMNGGDEKDSSNNRYESDNIHCTTPTFKSIERILSVEYGLTQEIKDRLDLIHALRNIYNKSLIRKVNYNGV